jgi:hypothetical protein
VYAGLVSQTKLTPENVNAFVKRNWALARESKDRAISKHIQTHGTDAAFALAQTLLNAVWPRAKVEKAQLGVNSLIEYTRKIDRAGSKRR